MTEILLNLYNQHGIITYTFLIFFFGWLYSYVFDIFIGFSDYLSERTLYYLEKRKQLKLLNKNLKEEK